MATPISQTIGQLFSYSGGASCKSVYDLLDANHPGWNEDTSLDVLTYCEELRTAGIPWDANFGLIHALTTPQKAQFIAYILQKIIDITPLGYSRRAAMIQLRADIVDYMTTPTTPKRNALIATAKAIKPTTSQAAEILVANVFKSITQAVATNTVTGEVLYDVYRKSVRGALQLASLDRLTVEGAVLTKLEQIIGVLD